MNLLSRNNVVKNSALVLALMSISGFAAAQHNKEEHESRPAQHESRPSNQSHGNPQSHASGGSHAAAPNRPSGANRSSGATHASSASHGTIQQRPSGNRAEGAANNRPAGNAGRAGNENRGNVGGNRPGNAAGNRGGNAGFNRGGTRGGNMAGNRGATANHTAPGRTVSLRGGGTASVRPNGQIRSINRNGIQIHNNLRGGRTIVSVHNNVRVVNYGRGGGYVQHAYITRGGHAYYSRTFYSHGVYHVGVYRGYYYHGFQYYGYHPAFWFHPGFYGWGYRPWGVGVSWGIGYGGWGWAGSPWWGFYGGWFTPYPVYSAPYFWLTDYLIAADLQAAYEARADANAEAAGAYDQPVANAGPDAGQVTLSPEVKQAIAEEVKAELAAQQQEAAQGGGDAQAGPAPASPAAAAPASSTNEVPPALDPARRTFVVDNSITVVANGQECELTGGDVITRLTDTPDADNKVTASVSASKKSDCGAGAQVAVSVEDLQEMSNHFEEQLGNGMKELAAKQGTGDMPKAPETGTVASDIPAPDPDKDAAKDLSDQEAAANQTETQVKQEAAPSAGPGGQ